MKKWCEPFWSCLVLLLIVQMSGCAAPQWMSRKGSRDKSDRKVADLDQRDSRESSKKKKEKPKVVADKKKDSARGDDPLMADKSKAKPKTDADEAFAAARAEAKRKSDEALAAAERKSRSSADAEVEGFAPKTKRKNDDLLAAADRKSRQLSDVEEDDLPKKRKLVETVAAADRKDVETKKAKIKRPDPAVDEEDLVATRKPAKRAWADAEELAEVREVSHEEDEAAIPEWAREEQSPAKTVRSKAKRSVALDDQADDDEQQVNDPFAGEPVVAKNKTARAAEKVAVVEDWPSEKPSARKISKSTERKQVSNDTETEESAESDPLLAKKLVKLKPSQASYVNHCPQAQGEVRELVVSLDDKNPEQVKKSVHRLGRMGPDAVAALPALEQLQHHSDGYVRVHAALAICRIDAITPAAMETLTGCLKTQDPGLRSFSAAVIAELGPQNAETLAVLAEMLDDRDAYVRLHVAEVLIRYDEWSEQSLNTLLACLKHRDENIRWLTAYSLAELAPQTPEAVAGLAKRLEDESPKVQIGAAYALGEIGPLSRAAAKDLRKHQKDANPELRAAVVYALEQIDGTPAAEVKQSAHR